MYMVSLDSWFTSASFTLGVTPDLSDLSRRNSLQLTDTATQSSDHGPFSVSKRRLQKMCSMALHQTSVSFHDLNDLVSTFSFSAFQSASEIPFTIEPL